jgi:suppressor for copper-sensitivity B
VTARFAVVSSAAAVAPFWLLAGAPAAAVAGPWVEHPEVRVRLVAAPAAGSNALDLGVEFALPPGWHSYWKNSGDAGYAPKLDLSKTPEIAEAKLLFPAPHRFDLPGGLVSFGYENEVIYPVITTVRPGSVPPTTLRGTLDYLVCAEECIPFRDDLVLDLPSGGAAEDADAARLRRWREALPERADGNPDAPRIAASFERGDYPFSTLELTVTGGGFRAASPDLFFASHRDWSLGRPELAIDGAGLRFRVPVRPVDETRALPADATFAWTLTGLERGTGSFALEGESTVAVATTAIATPAVPTPGGALRRYAWIAAAIVVILAGIALRSRRTRTSQH